MYIDKTYKVFWFKQSQTFCFLALDNSLNEKIWYRKRETEEGNMRCVYNGRKHEGGGVEQKCPLKGKIHKYSNRQD